MHALRRLTGLLPLAVYGLAILCFLSAAESWSDFPLDDAWIHRVYSRSVAHGRGFEYNIGSQEAGATSPLWAIATAPAHWLEPLGPGTVVVTVKLIAALCGGGALLALLDIGRRATGSLAAGVIAATLFATDPRLVFSTLSGMENTLLLALWLGATRALLNQRQRALWWVSLAPLCRPEAAILLPLWLLARVIFDRQPRLSATNWTACLLAAAPLAGWSLFCLAVTGHWLPNTFYVKARPFQLGRDELSLVSTIVTQHGYAGLSCFGAGIVGLVGWGMARRNRRSTAILWLLVLAPVLYAAAVASSRALRTDGYYWTRWIDPASLALTAAWCLAVGTLAARAGPAMTTLLHRRPGAPYDRPHLAAALGVIAACWLAADAPRFAASFAERRDRLASDSRAIHTMDVEVGRWLHDHTPADARVAVDDPGATRYFGQRWTLDLFGLNNAPVAFGQRTNIDDIDWVAMFPGVYNQAPPADQFAVRKVFEITPAEYTVCACPNQTRLVIFERIRHP